MHRPLRLQADFGNPCSPLLFIRRCVWFFPSSSSRLISFVRFNQTDRLSTAGDFDSIFTIRFVIIKTLMVSLIRLLFFNLVATFRHVVHCWFYGLTLDSSTKCLRNTHITDVLTDWWSSWVLQKKKRDCFKHCYLNTNTTITITIQAWWPSFRTVTLSNLHASKSAKSPVRKKSARTFFKCFSRSVS